MTRLRLRIFGVLLALVLAPSGVAEASGSCSIFRTWSTGDSVTAADLNSSFQTVGVTNFLPSCMDSFSQSAGIMQSSVDPYTGGSESLATSLQGELQRIRFVLQNMSGWSQWYIHNGFAATTSRSATSQSFTWNNAGVTFPGAWKLNVTDTASNAASLLFDLQLSTVSKWSVRKDGTLITGIVPAALVTGLPATPYAVSIGGTGAASFTQFGLLAGNAGSTLSVLTPCTNGQIPIGSTGAATVCAAITAGANITVTPAPNGITIASTAAGTAPPDVQVFTATGTWTKASGVSIVVAEVVGAGGGGGGGDGSNGSSDGGSGGGGAAIAYRVYRASDLSATESVTVGVTAAGGASESNGTAGGPSCFRGTCGTAGSLTAFGGGFGAGANVAVSQGQHSGGGGGGTAGVGGNGGVGSTTGGLPSGAFGMGAGAAAISGGGSGDTTGAAGSPAEYGGGAGGTGGDTVTSTVGFAGGTSLYCGGGGGGGGATIGNGGDGGGVGVYTAAGGGGGAHGVGGGAPTAGAAGAAGVTIKCGTGGGGGGATNTAATRGGNGGAGGIPGGGGGGGGAGRPVGTGGGDGGTGARGEVRVYSW